MDIWTTKYSTLMTLEECAILRALLETELIACKQTISELEDEGVNPEYLDKEKRRRHGIGQRMFKLNARTKALKSAERATHAAGLTAGGHK